MRRDYARPRAWSLVAVLGVTSGLSLLMAAILIAWLTPTIAVPDRETRRILPMPRTTGSPKPALKVNKNQLVIMQNPNCWVGIPGVTCDSGTRTYA